MLKRLLRLLAALALLIIWPTTIILAQVSYPPLVGSVADQTGQLSVVDVQAAIDRLARRTGATPLALAYNNRQGLDPDAYEIGFLQNNRDIKDRFALPDGQIRDDIILIAIDYQDAGIKVRYGDNFTAPLDPVAQRVQDNVIANFAGSDPTKAFSRGFDSLADAIDQYQRAQSGQVGGSTQTTVDTSGLGRALVIIGFWIAIIAAVLGLGYLFFTYLLPWWISTRHMLAKIRKLRTEVHGLITNTMLELPDNPKLNNNTIGTLILIYEREQPEKAQALEQEYVERREATAALFERVSLYNKRRLNMLISHDDLLTIEGNYQTLEEEIKEIIEWISDTNKLHLQLSEQLDQADEVVEAAIAKLDQAINAYLTSVAGSNVLPQKADEVSGKLYETALAARGALKEQKFLTAVQFARELEDLLELFALARESLLAAEGAVAHARTQIEQISGPQMKTIRVPDVDQILEEPNAHLANAADYFIDGNYAAAREGGQQVTLVSAAAIVAVQRYIEVLDASDTITTRIAQLVEEGYRNIAQALLAEADADIEQVKTHLASGNYKEVRRWCDELLNDVQRAEDLMVGQDELRRSNLQRLKFLAENVAAAWKRREETILPLYDELETGFKPEDWDEVYGHYDQAGKLLLPLFDKPENPDDLCSRVDTCNSFANQEFVRADELLDQAENDLNRAMQLIDEIVATHTKVTGAKRDHLAAIERAKARFEEAVRLRDESNKKVSPDVDVLLVDATRAAAMAETAREAQIYTDVMAACQLVHQLCDQAIAEIRKQVAHISGLIEKKDTNKAHALEAIAQLKSIIAEMNAAVLQQDTHTCLSSATYDAEAGNMHETTALTVEDAGMAAQLELAGQAYGRAFKYASDGQRAAHQDQRSYNDLMTSAREEVDEASREITAAANLCNDSRAGNAGDAKLARARQLLPASPSIGTTRQQLETIINNANSAMAEARAAAKEAKRKIDDYEDERRKSTYTPTTTTTTTYRPSPIGGSYGGGGSTTRTSFTPSFGGGGSTTRSGFKR